MAASTSTSDKIRKRLKEKWPELSDIWLTDGKYLLPEVSDLEPVFALWNLQLHDFKYVQNLFECEEFALFFHAAAKKYQIFNREDPLNWCLGECITKELLGFPMVHSCNLFLTKDKIYMIEPQTGAYWEANPEEDKVFFVNM